DPKTHVNAWYIWEYLILVDGKVRTLLFIQQYGENGETIFRIGVSSIMPFGKPTEKLAEALERLLVLWPAVDGYQHRIIKYCEDLGSDKGLTSFVELSQNGKVLGFFPLTYFISFPDKMWVMESFTPGDLLDPDQFLSERRSEAKRILESFRKSM